MNALRILGSAPEKLHEQQLLFRKLWPVTLERTVVPALSKEWGWARGDAFQDPQPKPKSTGSTEPCIYFFFSVYTYL